VVKLCDLATGNEITMLDEIVRHSREGFPVIHQTASNLGSKAGESAVGAVPSENWLVATNNVQKDQKLAGSNGQAEMVDAFRRHQAGDLVAAARGYQGILARYPNHADAAHLLGLVYHVQGHSTKAIELIGRAVALCPGVPAFHASLAEAYRATRQIGRAAGCCRTALQLWKDYPEAHNNLGLTLQALGRNDEAPEHFKASLALRPNDPTTHSNIGMIYRALGQSDLALEHFRRAVEPNGKLALARSNLGQNLLDLGSAEEALPHCREAVALQPDLAEAHNNLGNVYRMMAQYTEARASYLEALRIKPDLPQAIANLALSLHREGRLNEAMPWLERAAELDPAPTSSWSIWLTPSATRTATLTVTLNSDVAHNSYTTSYYLVFPGS
jgi:tetratricopeptide (TPR) repeat protein